MRRQLLPALRTLAALTVLTGVIYPALVTVAAQVAMSDRADGSLIRDADGEVVGSSLLGQPFDGPAWFHPRPSAAGDGYDGRSSSASNLGPTNPDLLEAVAERADAYRELNELEPDADVPVDAVTASGSGLDPHISIANARTQAPRVARARGLAIPEVLALVDAHTDRRPLGFLGEAGVNTTTLNAALDARAPRRGAGS